MRLNMVVHNGVVAFPVSGEVDAHKPSAEAIAVAMEHWWYNNNEGMKVTATYIPSECGFVLEDDDGATMVLWVKSAYLESKVGDTTRVYTLMGTNN